MSADLLLRVYFDPAEVGVDGYPHAWHFSRSQGGIDEFLPAIKDHVREEAGHRCERCRHPYEKGMGEWSPCDDQCRHGQPFRFTVPAEHERQSDGSFGPTEREAQWRILTVHHLNGVKHDCRWWNLAALCQRCHLTIQAKVHLDRPYDRPHSDWFRPHAAGYYASLLPEEPTREWVMEHMAAILARAETQPALVSSYGRLY